MIDFSAAAHAVLSQHTGQHLQDFHDPHLPALNQTDHHPHMLQHRPLRWEGGTLLGLCLGVRRFAVAVLDGLLDLARVVTVILDTPPCGLPFAVGLFATKGTTQVFPTSIPRMGEEKDPTMPAAAQALSQEGFGSQNRSQEDIILQNQSANLIPSIPLRLELEEPRDPNCKKPKLSLRMLMY